MFLNRDGLRAEPLKIIIVLEVAHAHNGTGFHGDELLRRQEAYQNEEGAVVNSE